ncbi:MAG: alpha/beta hydrolase [Stenomitos rutilans HA7619-LM2]|jgi:pimeloyl-ACP methyl ester carboxylesterase|nr:alpha/beta hydrolase [Stenomitos rutilans HA7619-LM2]
MGETTPFYTWQNYRCAYDRLAPNGSAHGLPLLLIHPIGVGLSRTFWQRFCDEWSRTGQQNPIYNPDLLGCGESAMPSIAYYPSDWAKQLQYFLQTVIQTPVVVVVQGALLPVAIELVHLQPDLIRGLVMSGPPARTLIANTTPTWQQRVSWNLFDSPLGNGFYRYARRSQFLHSFSTRQLFATAAGVDAEWLAMLRQGSADLDSRHAVFSFLAGFWRQDYTSKLKAIAQPTLIAMGEQASSISRKGKSETPDERLQDYLAHLPHSEGVKLPGRNVLPYESTAAFVEAIVPFIQRLQAAGVKE